MSASRLPFSIPEHVVARKLDDEMVLLNLDSGEYFGLNDTGTRIWELLVEGHGRDEVARRLTEEFEVAAEVASDHVAVLCKDLLEAGLLAREDNGARGAAGTPPKAGGARKASP